MAGPRSTTTAKKTARPETADQANLWAKIKTHYLKLGLCHGCAAQAAYGSQLGFSNVHPPCSECVPMVATFDSAQVNGWRSTPRDKRGRANAVASRDTSTGWPAPKDADHRAMAVAA